MNFEFSTTVNGTSCHIRSYQSRTRQTETVNERPHKHFFMEFHCVFQGEEKVFLPGENRLISLTAGQILLIPREIYHASRTEKGTVERLCFNFSAELPRASRDREELFLFRPSDRVLLFEDPPAMELARQCRLLQEEKEAPLFELRRGSLLLSLVFRLFSRISDARSFSAGESPHRQRQRWIIEEYIDRNFADAQGIAGLSRALYLSQRQTRTLVRRFLGEDFKTLIIRRRMELAEIYLKTTDRSLEEIAWQVGYRSYSGFQLCFKQYFGISPSKMRKSGSPPRTSPEETGSSDPLPFLRKEEVPLP